MNNLLVLPLLIPAITAVILIFLKERVRLQRIISAVSVFLNIFVAGFIVYQVNTNGIQTLYMGDGVHLMALCLLPICFRHCSC